MGLKLQFPREREKERGREREAALEEHLQLKTSLQ